MFTWSFLVTALTKEVVILVYHTLLGTVPYPLPAGTFEDDQCSVPGRYTLEKLTWNLKITCWKRKLIWTKPSFVASSCGFSMKLHSCCNSKKNRIQFQKKQDTIPFLKKSLKNLKDGFTTPIDNSPKSEVPFHDGSHTNSNLPFLWLFCYLDFLVEQVLALVVSQFGGAFLAALISTVSSLDLIFNWVISRFHANFQWCSNSWHAISGCSSKRGVQVCVCVCVWVWCKMIRINMIILDIIYG